VVFIILVAAIFLRISVRRAFPQVDGTLQVPGLSSQVEVIRDAMGVPHIYADTVEDLFMAQGFVHAQDRFYQMDTWRHISSGRLSEMFGSSQVETDALLRTMGWARLAETQYEREQPSVRAILDAYADGVNAYVASRSPAELGFEYSILELLNHGYDPAPWTGAESLAWGKVMSFSLGGNLHAEVSRAMALGIMARDRVDQLYPPYPGDRHPFIVPGGANAQARDASFALPDDLVPILDDVAGAITALNELTGARMESGIGSNSWAVSGMHTPTGAPMLANDPHLGIQMPSIWYQVGLHCRTVDEACPFDVAGFSFAGVPGVIIGHNADIAWGFTNVGPDVQDLYIERVNPDDPDQYEVDGAWVDMDTRRETIAVAGGDPVEIVVRSTIHGPVISGVLGDMDSLSDSWIGFSSFDGAGVGTPDPYVLALRWTGLDDVPSIAGPIMGINTASNFDEFREAALLFSDPSQNLLYADTRGNIGYQMPGNIPIRSKGDGTIPVPGWTGEYEWTGFIPYDELPRMYNPDSGWIVTANNAVVDETFPYLITEDWSRGYRAQRIVDLLTANLGADLEFHGTIQFDGYDANAEFLAPFVLEAVRTSGAESDEAHQRALELLAGWDRQNSADSPGAAIWQAVWSEILVATFHDELPEFLWPEGGDRWFEVVRGLVGTPEDAFWDDVGTPGIETRDDILGASFDAAITELVDTLGDTVDDWTWGDLHRVVVRNPTLGESGIGLIEDRFNRGPFPASGSQSVPNAMGWDAAYGYEVDWIPSMRMLVDLGDLSRSYAIHSTGQSGHTDHPHYDDMIPLWLAGDTAPMLWVREDIEASSESTLVLTP
jgi:penicillin amidase